MTLCRDVFGNMYILENMDQTNLLYGGLKLPGSKIILTSGSLDPWHVVGITNETGTGANIIYIHGKLSEHIQLDALFFVEVMMQYCFLIPLLYILLLSSILMGVLRYKM